MRKTSVTVVGLSEVMEKGREYLIVAIKTPVSLLVLYLQYILLLYTLIFE